MKISIFLLAICILHGTTTAHSDHRHLRRDHPEHQERRLGTVPFGSRCGTHEPTEKNRVDQLRAQALSVFKKARLARAGRELETSRQTRVIPVCFHTPSYWNPITNLIFRGRTDITNDELQRELDHLNEAFTSSSCCDTSLSWCNGECSIDIDIQFVMAKTDDNWNVVGTTSSTSDSGACVRRPRGFRFMRMRGPLAERRIKRKLRVGGPETLNIYFIRPGRVIFRPFVAQTLGFAYFPSEYADDPVMDGVVIEPTVMRGIDSYEGDVNNADFSVSLR